MSTPFELIADDLIKRGELVIATCPDCEDDKSHYFGRCTTCDNQTWFWISKATAKKHGLFIQEVTIDIVEVEE